uniref:DNA polymerase kappa n=1 Tax=Romanomermis culicivorax TaxID=13658 RepID=A0A915J324_ROMCU
MEINDNKAGMQHIDKAKINDLIKEASKNSKFAKHQEKREKLIQERIQEQNKIIATFSAEKLKLAEMQVDKLVVELEARRDLSTTFVHLDMDCFFAAVEMRDNPDLRNKPMAVGSNSMLSTSNYEARKYGVRAAMPGFIGRKLCPQLILVPVNFDKYRETSQIIRQILVDYDSDLSMSIDEAYLNMTTYAAKRHGKNIVELPSRKFFGDCLCKLPRADEKLTDKSDSTKITEEKCELCGKTSKIYNYIERFGDDIEEIAREMRHRIEQTTGLTASAGIANNAMLAKICSDKNKPNGQFCLSNDRDKILKFVSNLPIRKVGGIGSVTEAMLKSLGIEKCADIFEKRAFICLLHSEISRNFLMRVSLGLDSNTFEFRDSDKKSISVERTFQTMDDPKDLQEMCRQLCQMLAEDVKSENWIGRTITLKLKTDEFEVKTRAQSLKNYVHKAEDFYECCRSILNHEIQYCAPNPLRLRLMGN